MSQGFAVEWETVSSYRREDATVKLAHLLGHGWLILIVKET
jgi:hypothetical protein